MKDGGLRPAPGVRLFILDDEGILFVPASQELYSLNAAATAIWCLLEESCSRIEIAAWLARTQRLTLAQAGRSVARLIRRWRLQRLIVDPGDAAAAEGRERAPEEDAQGMPALRPATDLPPLVQHKAAVEHRYRLLDRKFQLRFATREQADWVHPVLRHLEISPGRMPADETLDIVAAVDGRPIIYRDQQPLRALAAVDHLAPFVKAIMWLSVIEHSPLFLVIHAGVVGAHGRCLLFPAASSSGKSTLTAALARSGFSFFSDEVALVSDRRFAARPVPLGICVKSTGWDLMTPYYPELAEARTHHRVDGKIVRYLTPPAGPGRDAFFPVGAIVFPRYAPDLTTALVPLGKAEALRRLLKECLVVKRSLDERNIARLIEWMKGTPCYELPNSSLKHACELLAGLASRWS